MPYRNEELNLDQEVSKKPRPEVRPWVVTVTASNVHRHEWGINEIPLRFGHLVAVFNSPSGGNKYNNGGD